MGLLIDTSVLIGLERSGQDAVVALSQWAAEDWYLSCITASELLHGVHRAKDVTTRVRRSAFVEQWLQTTPILDVDLGIARTHAQVWAHMASQGHGIGQHDLWLAATCLTLDLGVLTRNKREFERVPGLRVECW